MAEVSIDQVVRRLGEKDMEVIQLRSELDRIVGELNKTKQELEASKVSPQPFIKAVRKPVEDPPEVKN